MAEPFQSERGSGPERARSFPQVAFEFASPVVIAALVGVALAAIFGVYDAAAPAAALTFLVLIPAGVIVGGFRVDAYVRARLDPHGGLLCPRCHYPIDQLPNEGLCPECGRAFTHGSVLKIWDETLRLNGRYAKR